MENWKGLRVLGRFYCHKTHSNFFHNNPRCVNVPFVAHLCTSVDSELRRSLAWFCLGSSVLVAWDRAISVYIWSKTFPLVLTLGQSPSVRTLLLSFVLLIVICIVPLLSAWNYLFSLQTFHNKLFNSYIMLAGLKKYIFYVAQS